MAAENTQLFAKESTATGSDVAVGTSTTKFDSWKFINDHASVALVVKMLGQTVTVKPSEIEVVNASCSPAGVTVAGNTCTYRLRAVSR